MLVSIATWISTLGSPQIISILTIGVTFYLAAHRKWHLAVLTLVSISLTAIIVTAMKWSFLRPRPDHDTLSLIGDPSFPSGHAALAAAFFVILGYCALKVYSHTSHKTSLSQRHTHLGRGFIIVVCILCPLLIGLSRLILHVHWPSDVLVGWVVGLTVAVISIFVAKRYSQISPR